MKSYLIQFTEENRKKALEIWEKAMTDEKFKELEKKYGQVPECVKLVGDRLPTKEEVEYGKTLAEYAKSKKVN